MSEPLDGDVIEKEELKIEEDVEKNDNGDEGVNKDIEEEEEKKELKIEEPEIKFENEDNEPMKEEEEVKETKIQEEIPEDASTENIKIADENEILYNDEEEDANVESDSEYENDEYSSGNEFHPQNKIAEYDESDDNGDNDDQQDDEEEENLESYLPQKPNFLNENLKLEDFTPAVLNPRAFPTNRFIAKFFSTLWSNINGIPKFYDPGATFTLTVDYHPSSKMALYSEFASNFITSDRAAPVGGMEIMRFQEHIFPRGFIAYPTLFKNHELMPGMYAVVVHGAFQGVESRVFGFDRTFVIVKYPLEYRITNETLHIRRAVL